MNKNFTPRVSIVIPVYNGSNYMKDAIDSALTQTYKNLEIIVIDDGSTDKGQTERIALSYGDKIKYYKKENGGVSTALNYGIEKMTGEYFSWLSHDDMYLPEKIAKQVEALKEDKESISVCDVTVVSATGDVLNFNKISNRFNTSVTAFLALDVDTGLNGCSLLVPKILFEKYGVFNPELKCTQDYDLWYRFSRKTKFIYIADSLVLSRQHELQDSKTKTDLCTIESDKLHSKILLESDLEEIQKYFNNDIDYAIHIYEIYFNSGYLKTAACILNHLFKIYKRDIIKLFNQEILGSLDYNYSEKIFNIITSQLNNNSNKPTLLFYSNVWVKGGIERVLSILFEELKEDYNIILVSNKCNEPNGFTLPNNITHILINDNLGKNLPYSLATLCLMLNVDIFIGNPNIIYDFLDIYSILRDLDIKSICYNHAYYFIPYWSPWLFPIIKKRKEAYSASTVSTWLTSFGLRTYMASNDNGAYMPNPNTFKVEYNNTIDKKEDIVLCVGRFYDTIKRIDQILRIFTAVYKKNNKAKLYLVGAYDLSIRVPSDNVHTLKELIEELDIPKNSIIWLGEQNNIQEYYKKAKVLILASDCEGFPMVLTEAGAYGIPAVIFDIPGIDDVIKNNENGFIIKRNNISEMANKICLLLENDSLRIQMGESAQKLVERFSRENIGLRWKNLINFLFTTDSKEEINQKLKSTFNTEIMDKEQYINQIISEYEKNIINIINSYDKNIEELRNNYTTQIENLNSIILDMNKVDDKPPSMHRHLFNSRLISLIKRGLKYFKTNGFIKTVKKFIEKLKKKFNRRKNGTK